MGQGNWGVVPRHGGAVGLRGWSVGPRHGGTGEVGVGRDTVELKENCRPLKVGGFCFFCSESSAHEPVAPAQLHARALN